MTPKEYYIARREKLNGLINEKRSQIRFLSLIRLLLFLLGAIGVYFFWGNWPIVSGILIVEVPTFLFLISRHSNNRDNLRFLQKQLDINENEINILNGGQNFFDDGEEFLSSDHYYNMDLDLFGPKSLFSKLNRTTSRKGREKLAGKLNSNDLDDIPQKQASLIELSKLVDWRQEYGARAMLANPEVPLEMLVNWITEYQRFTKRGLKWVPLLFGIGSVVMISLFVMGITDYVPMISWLAIGLIIVGAQVAKTNKLYTQATKAQDVFKQYANILLMLENREFESDNLKNLHAHFINKNVSASKELQHFSMLTDYLGNRNNILLTVILNGFFLWDLIYTRKIENWMEANRDTLKDWVDIIYEFDSLNSLANYVYNSPTFCFPDITKGEVIIHSNELGHPLISEVKIVRNDTLINDKNFFIITGANMAGKSTYLRTIGLSIVMSNIGLPVNAKSFVYKPVKLVSSMRTSDSLADDESYFFSELKRLKFIVDLINKEDHFIILDEILKGTNSKDKAEGSQKFVRKLVDSGSTGLIATHDLSLCTLADSYSQVSNYYFDAEIVNDELHFDYRMKEGVCKNMNASFLLRKMNIV